MKRERNQKDGKAAKSQTKSVRSLGATNFYAPALGDADRMALILRSLSRMKKL